jgi:Fibronectin type III domain
VPDGVSTITVLVVGGGGGGGTGSVPASDPNNPYLTGGQGGSSAYAGGFPHWDGAGGGGGAGGAGKDGFDWPAFGGNGGNGGAGVQRSLTGAPQTYGCGGGGGGTAGVGAALFLPNGSVDTSQPWSAVVGTGGLGGCSAAAVVGSWPARAPRASLPTAPRPRSAPSGAAGGSGVVVMSYVRPTPTTTTTSSSTTTTTSPVTSTDASTSSTTGAASLASTGTPGVDKVLVSWDPPASNGGDPIKRYAVRSSIDGGATWQATSCKGKATSCTLAGLSSSDTYVFEVSATNSNGPSPWSAPSVGVSPKPAPTASGAPTQVDALAGDDSATVFWSVPANGGKPITSYDVQYSDDSGTTWSAPVTCADTEPSCTVTGLSHSRS